MNNYAKKFNLKSLKTIIIIITILFTSILYLIPDISKYRNQKNQNNSVSMKSASFYTPNLNNMSLLYEKVWTELIDSSGEDPILVDKEGNIIIGTMYSLRKIAQNGTEIWMTSQYWNYMYNMAIDHEDNIYIVGGTSGVGDLKLEKYSSTGQKLWSRLWGGSSYDMGYGVVIDSNNSIYTVGTTESFGNGSVDFLLIKWSSNGNVIWNQTWGGNLSDGSEHIAIDSNDFVYTSGYTNSFNGSILLKWNSTGGIVWNRTSSNFGFESILCGSENSIYIEIRNISAMGLSKWDSEGNNYWNSTIPVVPYMGYCRDLCNDTNGNIFLLGKNNYALLLLKFSFDGIILLNQTWQYLDNNNPNCIKFVQGNMYIFLVTCTSTGYDPKYFIFQKWGTNINPVLSTPSDQIMIWNTTGNQIIWNVSDIEGLYNPIYEIFRNSTSIINGTWTSNQLIVLNLDGLQINHYNYMIYVRDGSDGIVNDSVLITVIPDISIPTIISSNDTEYIVGTKNNFLVFNILDNLTRSTSYKLFQNSSLKESGSWISNQSLLFNIDNLPLGIHNFTLQVFDGLGNVNYTSIFVYIIPDLSIPDVLFNGDCEFTVNTKNHIIYWKISDTIIGDTSYILLKNNTEIQRGIWGINQTFSLNIENLIIGQYNYTLISDDGCQNVVQNELWIRVKPNNVTNPILNSPDDISYIFSTITHDIVWNVSDVDFNLTSFIIYRNGTIVQNGSWINEQEIRISVDGLSVGVYNYTIVVDDGLGGQNSDLVWVTVMDNSTIDDNSPVIEEIDGYVMNIFILISLFSIIICVYQKKRKFFSPIT